MQRKQTEIDLHWLASLLFLLFVVFLMPYDQDIAQALFVRDSLDLAGI